VKANLVPGDLVVPLGVLERYPLSLPIVVAALWEYYIGREVGNPLVVEVPVEGIGELAVGLPELGSNLEVWGELKPRTGRLVVTKAQTAVLPPKREMVTPAAG
jgi:hypothetical protein